MRAGGERRGMRDESWRREKRNLMRDESWRREKRNER